MNYQKTVQELESRNIMPETAPSLEPMIQGLSRILSNSQFNPRKTVVVAGTNGKGSVSASLEALLLSAGESVGLYTSPHLEETTERIRLNGHDISKELFCKAYEVVCEKTSALDLTHFEVLTLIAAWIFYSGEVLAPVDWAIFEVGLGGTWDATNAIPHQNCIITTLGYDHQNLLGNSLTEIAQNKFGIISNGNLVIHSPLPEEVKSLALHIQSQTHSKWIECAPHDLDVLRAGPEFILKTKWGKTSLSLPGSRAAVNSATALTAFSAFGFDAETHLQALQKVRWPGRMEKVIHPLFPCPIYLSGDHNPDGVKSLLELLHYYTWNRLHILVGIGKDKDHIEMLDRLSVIPRSHLWLTETPFRGRCLADYGDEWNSKAKGAWSNPSIALRKIAAQAHSDDLILVTGSLYLVGEVKKRLNNGI